MTQFSESVKRASNDTLTISASITIRQDKRFYMGKGKCKFSLFITTDI